MLIVLSGGRWEAVKSSKLEVYLLYKSHLARESSSKILSNGHTISGKKVGQVPVTVQKCFSHVQLSQISNCPFFLFYSFGRFRRFVDELFLLLSKQGSCRREPAAAVGVKDCRDGCM